MKMVRGYELGERIGAGGFGEVYRAYQPDVEREVAIKVIRPEYVNNRDFILRFEAEAHIVARLEHIHIVPLYDYWREPTGAYLVMRWLPDNLRKVLKARAPSVKSIATWFDQITAGLTIAHRRQIIHRDLKPDNILLDGESNAYLADFGIAKILDDTETPTGEKASGFIGSVAYSPPEQLRGEKVTPQTDIYSLGVMLFELLTRTTPFVGVSFNVAWTKQITEALPSLKEFRNDLPDQVDTIIQKATHKEAAQRFTDVTELAAAFNQAVANRFESLTEVKANVRQGNPAQIDPNLYDAVTYVDGVEPGFSASPFKGLRAFNEADAGDFFGRADLTRRLVARFTESTKESHLLAVVGPSGSGKTSVVLAGLVPALRHGAIPGSERWFEIELTPGSSPLQNLEAALLSVAVNPPPNIKQQLARDRNGFLNVVRAILPGGADEEKHLLVVIDQFEEIFTMTEDQSAIEHFLELIYTAIISPGSPVYVVLTLRADFYDRPLLYPEFGDLIRKRTEVVLPLTTADLTDAIIKPCMRAGLSLEPQLIAEIIRDVSEQPGALPLMQYALTELYARRQGQILTAEMYRQTGGVLGALAQRADDLFKSLDEVGQRLAEQLFLRLVTLGEGSNDTRRRAQQSEVLSIADKPKQINEVIQLYSKFWLLTFDSDPITRVPTLEIAHEALIQRWDKLQNWLANSREEIHLQRSLAVAANEWLQTDRDLDYLAIGARLAQFRAVAEAGHIALNEDERLFVEASIAAQQAREAEIETRRQNQIALGERAASLAKKAESAQSKAAQRLVYLAAVLLLFLLVAAGLLVRTLIVAQQAQASAQQAQASAKIAQNLTIKSESLRLAANAVSEARSDNGELATLLALRSMKLMQTIPADAALQIQGDAALQQALARNYIQQVFSVSQTPINDACFSADGRTVIGVLENKGSPGSAQLKVWDAKTGALLKTFTISIAGVKNIDCAHNGKLLALVNGAGSSISIWDITGNVPTQQQQWTTNLVKDAVFSLDDQTILAAEDKIAREWDIRSGSEIRHFDDHGAEVESATFSGSSNNDSFVLTASLDGKARQYNANSGQLLHVFDPLKAGERLHSAVFSSDGKYVAAGGYGELVYVWDALTGKLIQTLEGHADEVISLAFSSNNDFLVSGSADLSAIVWNVTGGSIERHYVGHSDTINRVTFSPDDASVLTVSADGSARLWLAGNTTDPNDPLPRQLSGHTGPVYDAAFSPDGNLLASASKDGTARVWDAHTGKLLLTYKQHSQRVWWIAFSPNSKQIVTASDDGTAQVWDALTGQTVQILGNNTGTVWTAAFSPDGTKVVTGGLDNTGHVWDLQTGKELFQLSGHTGPIYGSAFSPDGNTIVTASVDTTVRLWDAKTGAEIRQFLGHSNQVYTVAFSHDGKYIVTASRDKTARIWDVATGNEIKSFAGHNDVVWTAQFSADDKHLLTSGQDRTARVWDIKTGVEIRRITGHTLTVTSATFSPDNQWIATTSYDHTIRLTRTDPTTLVSAACQYVVRDLTAAERTEFGIQDPGPTCPSSP